MKLTKITTAILAGLLFAGTAQAVNINPDGTGQVLLFPYYTTNAGHSTVFSVVNTTDEAKAAKVRFLEGENSREVLDFNLYLSAHDVWTAAIVDLEGVPTLIVEDTTCTVPYLFKQGGAQPFLPWALDDKDPEKFDDISRASEGHFEIIGMGTIVDEMVENKLGVMVPKFGTAEAVTHVDGFPADCEQLTTAWTPGAEDDYWIDNPFADMQAPSGGLFGGAAIVNVQKGYLFSYDAVAINGFASKLDAADDMHQEPGTILPSLDSGDILSGTVFSEDGTTHTETFGRGVDAMSFVLMKNAIMNTYTTERVIAAQTEWVITFPTKQFYVNQDFLNEYAEFRDVNALTAPLAPFTSTWTWDEEEGMDYACEEVVVDTIWNREEAFPEVVEENQPPLVSPRPPGEVIEPDEFNLCFETQILSFTDRPAIGRSKLLGSSNFYNVNNPYDKGWMRIDLDTGESFGGLDGLPVTGFSVSSFANGFINKPGGVTVMSSYGSLFEHKATRQLSSD